MSYFIIAVAITALIAGRARYVWTHPNGPHWLCKGTGKNRGPAGRARGHCRPARCRSGEVLRPSARALYRMPGREAK
jgi:hypothetical protein